jgi:hypothetical protein
MSVDRFLVRVFQPNLARHRAFRAVRFCVIFFSFILLPTLATWSIEVTPFPSVAAIVRFL